MPTRFPLIRWLPLVGVALTFGVAQTGLARVWKSKNGNYQLEADAISFNEKLVVLKKPAGELVAVELADLSDEDQAYVRSKEAKDAERKSASVMQTWTTHDGMKVLGRVLDYGKRDLVVQRRLGNVMIGDKKFTELDPLHQKLVLRILSHVVGQPLENERQLQEWAKSLAGKPQVIPLEGVLLQLESGDQIGVPFFLFSEEDLAVLQPGWELWLERNESEETREQESFLMRSAALAYQRDRAAFQQIEMLKLNLLAAATGVVEIWQVGLIPAPGTYGRPISVMVPAQNSQLAQQMVLQNYPGFILAGVRRASR